MASPPEVAVRLSGEQRRTLDRLIRTGTRPARLLMRARILPKADADGPDAAGDVRIGREPGCSAMTARRVRRQFAAEGLDATPHRKRPTGRQDRKPDGAQEAQLVAVACPPAPEGRARRTTELLSERPAELEVVESIGPAAAWRTPEKTR